MGDFSFTELIVVVIVAIIVYGKDLPQAARKLGQLYSKLRRQVSDIKDEISRQIPTEELKVDLDAPIETAVPTEPPSTPWGLSATVEHNQVYLIWNDAAGATSYTVRRSAGDEAYAIIATGVAGRGYTDVGLVEGKVYRYVVSAMNAAGESPHSDEVEATVPPPPPPPAERPPDGDAIPSPPAP